MNNNMVSKKTKQNKNKKQTNKTKQKQKQTNVDFECWYIRTHTKEKPTNFIAAFVSEKYNNYTTRVL